MFLSDNPAIMTDVELDLLARQNECILTELHSMRDEMGGMRDEIRALP